MTAWLSAMVAGDGAAVCSLMASGDRPITEIQGAGEKCAAAIAPSVGQLKKIGGAFAGLTITGATVKGDEATFTAATTRPPSAAAVIGGLKAVKIGSKWFITP